MPLRHKLVTLVALAALSAPAAACGEDDVDQARKDVRQAAEDLKGDLDNLSQKDLQNKLDEVEEGAKNGSEETKRKARELQDKIERELDSRK